MEDWGGLNCRIWRVLLSVYCSAASGGGLHVRAWSRAASGSELDRCHVGAVSPACSYSAPAVEVWFLFQHSRCFSVFGASILKGRDCRHFCGKLDFGLTFLPGGSYAPLA